MDMAGSPDTGIEAASERPTRARGLMYALTAGNLSDALLWAEAARDLETSATSFLLPTSTSLFYIPGTAFHGILSLRIAQGASLPDGWTRGKLLRTAADSFDLCLSSMGRPNLPPCLIGAARAASALGDESAAHHYNRLVAVWDAPPPACSLALEEARAFLGLTPSAPPPPSPHAWLTAAESTAVVAAGAASLVAFALGYLLGRGKLSRQRVGSSSLGEGSSLALVKVSRGT